MSARQMNVHYIYITYVRVIEIQLIYKRFRRHNLATCSQHATVNTYFISSYVCKDWFSPRKKIREESH